MNSKEEKLLSNLKIIKQYIEDEIEKLENKIADDKYKSTSEALNRQADDLFPSQN